MAVLRQEGKQPFQVVFFDRFRFSDSLHHRYAVEGGDPVVACHTRHQPFQRIGWPFGDDLYLVYVGLLLRLFDADRYGVGIVAQLRIETHPASAMDIRFFQLDAPS